MVRSAGHRWWSSLPADVMEAVVYFLPARLQNRPSHPVSSAWQLSAAIGGGSDLQPGTVPASMMARERWAPVGCWLQLLVLSAGYYCCCQACEC